MKTVSNLAPSDILLSLAQTAVKQPDKLLAVKDPGQAMVLPPRFLVKL